MEKLRQAIERRDEREYLSATLELLKRVDISDKTGRKVARLLLRALNSPSERLRLLDEIGSYGFEYDIRCEPAMGFIVALEQLSEILNAACVDVDCVDVDFEAALDLTKMMYASVTLLADESAVQAIRQIVELAEAIDGRAKFDALARIESLRWVLSGLALKILIQNSGLHGGDK